MGENINMHNPFISPNEHLQKQGFLDDYLDLLYSVKNFHMTKYVYGSNDGKDHYADLMQYPQYYLKKSDAELLSAIVNTDLLKSCYGANLFEIGPGSADVLKVKTLPLIESIKPKQYIAVDFEEAYAEQASESVAWQTGLDTWYMVCDAFKSMPILQSKSPTVVAVLGSTFGNLSDAELQLFFKYLGSNMRKGDSIIFTVDYCHDANLLQAAYGNLHMQQLIRNVMRNLKGEFNLENFDPESFNLKFHWNDRKSVVEMGLVATKAQKFLLQGYEIEIEDGKEYSVAQSRKFQSYMINNLAMRYGFELTVEHKLPNNYMRLIVLTKSC